MNKTDKPALLLARQALHKRICEELLGKRADSDALSVADTSSKMSRRIADAMAAEMGCSLCPSPPSSQTIGKMFTDFVAAFVRNSFGGLSHLRPGDWTFATKETGIDRFDQYEHLADLTDLLAEHPKVKAALGSDYFVMPDIVIGRNPIDDKQINLAGSYLGSSDKIAEYAALRVGNRHVARPTLHAGISCKWSMRSDRSQNTRTEALNLMRNRKGHTPIIVAVTMEPLPSRLASIAMGTGDVDCTYHAALNELITAIAAPEFESQREILDTLVEGRRIRDISDLPLDLAV